MRTTIAFLSLALAMVTTVPASAHPTIDVVAANWKFTPATITVHVGEPQTLRFTSAEGVHGVKSDELGIPQTTITPGGNTTVTFTAKKAGTYVVHCSIVCGSGHSDMKLTIVVEP